MFKNRTSHEGLIGELDGTELNSFTGGQGNEKTQDQSNYRFKMNRIRGPPNQFAITNWITTKLNICRGSLYGP